MPGGDRRGPRGDGPRTGRMAGYCSGYDQPGCMNDLPGMGLHRRTQIDEREELRMLEEEKERLEATLNDVKISLEKARKSKP